MSPLLSLLYTVPLPSNQDNFSFQGGWITATRGLGFYTASCCGFMVNGRRGVRVGKGVQGGVRVGRGGRVGSGNLRIRNACIVLQTATKSI